MDPDFPDQDEPGRLVRRWAADERGARRVLARFRDARARELPPFWRRPAFAAWAAGALAVVLLWLALRPGPRATAPAIAVAGQATWTLAREDGKPAQELTRGVTLAVASGEAALRLEPHLSMRVRAGGRVAIEELSDPGAPVRRVTLAQTAGSAVYELTPGTTWRLAVATPAGRVRVTGTRFRVDVKENESAVSVGRGGVEVSGTEPGPSRHVGASHRLVCRPGAPLPEPEAFNAIIDPDFAEAAPSQIGVTR